MVWLALVILAVILTGVITRKREPVYDPVIGEALLAAMDRIDSMADEIAAHRKAIADLRTRGEETRAVLLMERMARLRAEAGEPVIEIRQGRIDPDEKPN